MNLYQKIVEVRKVAGTFSKDKKGYGYDYVSGNQILSKIKDTMNELGLLLIPSTNVGEDYKHEYRNNKGQDKIDFVVKGKMSYTWINAENPEEQYTVEWAYYGQQDDISKAYGSALTYSERYFLLKCLGLPTDEDDPDSKSPNGNNKESLPKPQKQPAPADKTHETARKAMYAKAKELKYTDDQIKDYMVAWYNVDSTKKMTVEQLKEFRARLIKQAKEDTA